MAYATFEKAEDKRSESFQEHLTKHPQNGAMGASGHLYPRAGCTKQRDAFKQSLCKLYTFLSSFSVHSRNTK